MSNDRLIKKVYNEMSKKPSFFPWFQNIRNIVTYFDLQNLIENSSQLNHYKVTLKSHIQTAFDDLWYKALHNDTRQVSGNKLRTYRLFKKRFVLENYLLTIPDVNLKSSLTKFRISAHPLLIEKGRYRNIPIDKRLCPTCKDKIEDEIHFMLLCPAYSKQRNKLLKSLPPIPQNFTDKKKFICIMETKNQTALAHYVHFSLKKREQMITS